VRRTNIRVGLNFLYFITGMGGVETFGRELVRAFRHTAEEGLEFILFTSLDGQELKQHECDHLKVVVCPFHARFRGVRYFWEQFMLPWQTLAHDLDLLHSLAYVGPVFSFIPSILTIHDANTQMVEMKALRRMVLWKISFWAAHTANLVTTVSQFSRNELMKWYQLSQSRIQVITSGPGSSQFGESAPAPGSRVQELEIYEPYIAVIGGTYPHKNIPRVIEAFQCIASQVPHKLVIIGKVPPAVHTLLNRLDTDRIVFTGYLSNDSVSAIIARSDLFVMPSLYEGFGFPVLEAQAQGVPVACSSAGSLPEVTKDSAVLFDPENVQDIAGALVRCLTNRELNTELRKRSRENAATYSWKAAAASYLACYRQVAARSGQKIEGEI
jgi:glycosyltransferase involved in cell wall biosynthesis